MPRASTQTPLRQSSPSRSSATTSSTAAPSQRAALVVEQTAALPTSSRLPLIRSTGPMWRSPMTARSTRRSARTMERTTRPPPEDPRELHAPAHDESEHRLGKRGHLRRRASPGGGQQDHRWRPSGNAGELRFHRQRYASEWRTFLPRRQRKPGCAQLERDRLPYLLGELCVIHRECKGQSATWLPLPGERLRQRRPRRWQGHFFYQRHRTEFLLQQWRFHHQRRHPDPQTVAWKNFAFENGGQVQPALVSAKRKLPLSK